MHGDVSLGCEAEKKITVVDVRVAIWIHFFMFHCTRDIASKVVYVYGPSTIRPRTRLYI